MPLDVLLGKKHYKTDNHYAFNSMFIVVVKGLVNMVSEFEATGCHFNIDLENLFWTGNNVVVIYRKEGIGLGNDANIVGLHQCSTDCLEGHFLLYK